MKFEPAFFKSDSNANYFRCPCIFSYGQTYKFNLVKIHGENINVKEIPSKYNVCL